MSTVLIDPNHECEFDIIIKHWVDRKKNIFELQHPVVEDGVKWETERQGSAGKLTFKVYKDESGNLNFQEGEMVTLAYRKNAEEQWKSVFTGYIFSKKREKDDWIEVTAYDQLRYFKNKFTYSYNEKRASDVLKYFAKTLKFEIGEIDTTGYVISSRVEDDQSLFDIIQNALDSTYKSDASVYVLYSDDNKVYLRDSQKLKTDYIVNSSVAENFEYKSSIDEDVYNYVYLYYDNDETNLREEYESFDEDNVDRWGLLRYTENLNEASNAKAKAKNLLKLYNTKHRELKVSGAFGDVRCRGGASVIVDLNLGDAEVENYMIIEKAVHTFKKNEYRMDLTLDGFNIADGAGELFYREHGKITEHYAYDSCVNIGISINGPVEAGTLSGYYIEPNTTQKIPFDFEDIQDGYWGYALHKNSGFGIDIKPNPGWTVRLQYPNGSVDTLPPSFEKHSVIHKNLTSDYNLVLTWMLESDCVELNVNSIGQSHGDYIVTYLDTTTGITQRVVSRWIGFIFQTIVVPTGCDVEVFFRPLDSQYGTILDDEGVNYTIDKINGCKIRFSSLTKNKTFNVAWDAQTK